MALKIQRILVVRTDRIGDTILSTPVLETLHQQYPEADIGVLASPGPATLLEKCPYLKCLHLYDESFSADQKESLRKELTDQKYDVALVLYVHRGVLKLLKQAGIRERVGPASKLDSFLYLTKRICQNRSHSMKSEADYNLDLLQGLGLKENTYVRQTKVWTTPEDSFSAENYLKENKILPGEPFILIHPGSGGSALNWPLTRYRRFVREFCEGAHPVKVAVAAGAGEENIVQGMIIDLHGPIARFFNIPNLRVYAEILKRARLVVAGSTGPLHLAHAVGTPTIGLYSPVPVHRPERWGPFPEHIVTSLFTQPRGNTRSVVFIPDVECPVKKKCIGNSCSYSVEGRDCMGRILVDDVVQQARRLLELGARTQDVRQPEFSPAPLIV